MRTVLGVALVGLVACVGCGLPTRSGVTPFETDVRMESTELQYQLDLSMVKGVADSEVTRQARDIISSRLESNGIKNIRIAIEGKDRLRVTIPAGVGAPTLFIEELVSRVGHLQLQLVAGSPEHTAKIPEYRKATEKWEADFKAHVKLHDEWEAGGKAGEAPPEPPEPEYRVCPELEKNYETGHWVERGLLVLSNIPRNIVDGKQIKNARVSMHPDGSLMVVFSMGEGEEGAGKLGKLTSDNMDERLAIVLDGQVISAPTIKGRIDASGQITGDFTLQEVSSIATFLSGGRLPAEMTLVSRKVTSPKPGLPTPDSGK